MAYHKKRKCTECQTEFTIIGPRSFQCSPRCVLSAGSDHISDCWIWRRGAQRLGTQIRFNNEPYYARDLAFRCTGKVRTKDAPLRPTCGNPDCVRPEHIAETSNPAARRPYRKLTQADRDYISGSTESTHEIVRKLRCCPTVVQRVRRTGR